MNTATHPSPPTRRPRNSLSRDAILDAAETLARGGLENVTMRAVASSLPASPMAIYRYVATKEELVDAMLDRVLGRFVAPTPTEDWRADLEAFAYAHRQLLVEHAWAITVLFTHPSPGLDAVRIGECALRILKRGGLEGADAVAAFTALLGLNYGWAAFASASDPSRSDAAREIGGALAALDPDEFPLTLAVAGHMASYADDDNYDRALATLLRGIAT
jgi:AcrR family transcriptional regulator